MITVRRARPADAVAIGAVHVASWRSAYPGILPDAFLARLSVRRQAAYYDHAIRGPAAVHVAVASGTDVPAGSPPRLVGFAIGGRVRARGGSDAAASVRPLSRPLGDGEIETLYVLDDWRERGIGRRLIRAAAAGLAETGCRSVHVWVLRENPSRWFYERLGGRSVAEATVQVGGRPVVQTAFMWDPIERLLEASRQPT